MVTTRTTTAPATTKAETADRTFTEWTDAVDLDVAPWLDPHTLGGYGTLMYPSLIDVESPWLEGGETDPF